MHSPKQWGTHTLQRGTTSSFKGSGPSSARSVQFNNNITANTPIDYAQHDAKVRHRRASQLNLSHVKKTMFIGYGRIGYFNPFSFMSLPFRWKGTVIPQLIILMSTAFLAGIIANLFPQLELAPETHEVLGFVLGKLHTVEMHTRLRSSVSLPAAHALPFLGFLLVVMGNFSHTNYEKGVTCMNAMVQSGVTACATVTAMLPATKEGVKEIREFRRLILLYFRLCCFEVRSDLLARQNRKTWMHDSGQDNAVEQTMNPPSPPFTHPPLLPPLTHPPMLQVRWARTMRASRSAPK
jgi:hypothetical protein